MGGGRGVGGNSAHPPCPSAVQLSSCALLLSALLFVATGCTGLREWAHKGFKVGPNYCPPDAPLAPAWVEVGNGMIVPAPPEDYGWWHVFRDPTLDGLIETAYRQNLDLAAAVTRIMEARSRRSIAIGNLFPQSQSALATYAHGQISRNLGLPIQPSLN